MSIVATRFAPSPSGALHIGGVRTALFNWLFSKNKKGKFYLRIEDTDKERSKDEYKKQIIQSLNWIGIKYDDKEYIQSKNINKHKIIAEELLKKGFAYKCYCSEDEIKDQKDKAKQKGIPFIYNRKWRDPKNLEIPKNVDPVLRFKSKISGNTIIKDLVQGEVNISNSIIEDFVILRNDGTPTYQLSAVVDDHSMNITHVIRGDDHKINTFKQKQIYEAMNWKLPEFAHIPLIHSESGSKLSKRDKASTIDDYIKLGILSDALRNYLLRLGWSHKDKEIFNLDESIKLFDLDGVGKSPSKLDMSRILSLNEYYIKHINEQELFKLLKDYCKKFKKEIDVSKEKALFNSINFLKNKAKTLEDIFNNAKYILSKDVEIGPKSKNLLNDTSYKIIAEFLEGYKKINIPNKENLEDLIKVIINNHRTNFKNVGQPLRIGLTGSEYGPGIYDIILSLSKDEVVKRLNNIHQ